MSEVVAVVEGQTEQTFIRDHLAGHLEARGITIWSRLSGRIVRRGGIRSWESVRDDILRTLRERRGRICTTMFDFYGMPHNWPGRSQAAAMPLKRKGVFVEQALLDDLGNYAGQDFHRDLFVPYVQVHEFEALLFAEVSEMAKTLAVVTQRTTASLHSKFSTILSQAGQPEAINDSFETCPSRRITGIVPAYSKPLHGPIIAGHIGLEILRSRCPHFGQWLTRLESL